MTPARNIEHVAERLADLYTRELARDAGNAELLDVLFGAVADLDVAAGGLESAKVRAMLDFKGTQG